MGTHLSTGTAADLLAYDTFHHVSRNVDRLTRVSTASQDWIVKDWDGETYVIKFDKNFSKKHLFTFSKDTERTKLEAENQAARPGQAGKDLENWHNAEIELLKGKIAKNLDKRAVSTICNCGHPFNTHLQANPAPPPPNLPGFCNTCGAGTCAAFRTPYDLARTYVGKPTPDPLSGASTTRNTCIILNWVPKLEFEQIVVQSIQAFEKPHGWAKGQPLGVTPAPPGALPAVVNAATKTLTWDFGLGRDGAVILSNKNAAVVPPTFTYLKYQGCKVKAKKIATEYGRQTWEVFHMETGPGSLIGAGLPI